MINLLVWSKDRACQLHALLESVDRFAPDIFRPTVIYKATNESFKRGYAQVRSTFNKVLFIAESDFHRDTLEVFQDKEFSHVALSTDDTLFFQEVAPLHLWQTKLDNSIVAFSLRLGYNTIVQDIHAKPPTYQPPLKNPTDEGLTISWRFDMYHPLHNYGYPFGLDMHIYDRELLLRLAKTINFKNTNQLESGLFNKRNEVPILLRSFKHSKAVNVPVNNMSTITQAGQTYSFDIETLNKLYLEGQIIDIEKASMNKIVGCHQELPFEMRLRNG